MSGRIYSFAPVAEPSARVLILGSMPSVQSLSHGEYYAHPRNHFWPLMRALLDMPSGLDYAARTAFISARGIALWDSVAHCERKGSLDADIKREIPNDIPALLQRCPNIRAICFNGTTARKVFLRHHRAPDSIALHLLPSSSPIPRPGYITMEDKLPPWQTLLDYL